MPLYDYACTKCGHTIEVRHGFDETHAEPCAVCGAPVRRVFNPAPVLFKGSGFYVTDSRRSSAASKPEKAEKPKGEAISESSGTSTPKSENKPSEPAA
ncbi:MAG TPA: FmdB family zinc ribbon protein [Candidatus Cybelea sp.]